MGAIAAYGAQSYARHKDVWAMMKTDLSCFKAYDVRGQLGVNFNADMAQDIARAFAQVMGASSVVLGHDCRLSSPEISQAVIKGLMDEGVKVLDISQAGTEEVYFATSHLNADAGIMVTASHNPIDYNGLKLVGSGAQPLDDQTFQAIKKRVQSGIDAAENSGSYSPETTRTAYAKHIVGMVDVAQFAPLNLLVNAGNGVAGAAFDAILERLDTQGAKLNVHRINHAPDGTFPHGIPNPLLPENHATTGKAVRDHGADLGIAWDGDFDRCFFFDNQGQFVNGEHVVALLAQNALTEEPGGCIVYDPRATWGTEDAIRTSGGRGALAKVGHAYMKREMRAQNAIYGGELSAHHYFRDFMFCDSGMIPVVKMVALLSRLGRPMSDILADMRADFPSTGEINFRVADPAAKVRVVQDAFQAGAVSTNHLDGLSLEFKDWRMNLRCSNTEPLLRLNVETRGDAELLTRKSEILKALILEI